MKRKQKKIIVRHANRKTVSGKEESSAAPE
jgi:hypothetical protein